MTDVLIRNVDPKILERIKETAAANHRSLQKELKLIIEQAAGPDWRAVLERADRLRRRIRKRFPKQTDSTILIREDRDR